jgi:hypothetical protein
MSSKPLSPSLPGREGSLPLIWLPGCGDCRESDYQSRQAAYDLKKLRGNDMVRRVGKTRHYQPTSTGLRAFVALLVLRDKVIEPLLAASMGTRPTHGAQNPRTLDNYYETIHVGMQGVFRELGLAA